MVTPKDVLFERRKLDIQNAFSTSKQIAHKLESSLHEPIYRVSTNILDFLSSRKITQLSNFRADEIQTLLPIRPICVHRMLTRLCPSHARRQNCYKDTLALCGDKVSV